MGENMCEKVTIIVFINNYLPGVKSGGPVRSVANLIGHLGKQFCFKIITADRDLGDKTAYSNINIDKWNAVGNASVFYMSPKYQNMKGMLKIIQETIYDIIYINSFFNCRFTILPLVMHKFGLFNAPIIIAPRGELIDNAIKIKQLKKKIFMVASYFFDLYGDCTWQATNELEAYFIRKEKRIKVKKLVVASNLASTIFIDTLDHIKKKSNHLKICYVSRISKIKNLFYILEILDRSKGDINFDIYGPVEDIFYWNKCQVFINQLPSNIKVAYKGSINNSLVLKTISNYDLFFLPTDSENFGHCIVEAMLAGTPVLISDTTPWRDLESKGAGWDKPLDRPQDFLDVVNKLVPMGEDDFLPLRKKTLSYAKNITSNEESIQKNINMFLDVYAEKSK